MRAPSGMEAPHSGNSPLDLKAPLGIKTIRTPLFNPGADAAHTSPIVHRIGQVDPTENA